MKPVLPLWIALLALPRLAAAQTYRVTDLGTLPGGTYSEANGVNNKGDVTGDADTGNTGNKPYTLRVAPGHGRPAYHTVVVVRATHAFLWAASKMRDLGGDTMGQSIGNALNDTDAVVGTTSDGEGDQIAGYWGILLKVRSYDYGIALGINNKGEVVGEYHDYYATAGHHPFATGQVLDGVMADTRADNLPFNDAEATGINDAGLVVGSADLSAKPGTKPHHAVLWNKGVRQDLGTLPGGTESRAYAVNARGQIVGISSLRLAAGNDAVLYHAFLWESGAMRDLGTLPGDKQSNANAINAKGEIVGASGEHGCLWRNGKAYDLNALVPASAGWILQGATGINERRQIVGTGLHHGKRRGYLLTLRRPTSSGSLRLATFSFRKEKVKKVKKEPALSQLHFPAPSPFRRRGLG